MKIVIIELILLEKMHEVIKNWVSRINVYC
jgi:hypothetical protein